MVAVQWYPGHMEKARREMAERLKSVDLIIELRDARVPAASANPVLQSMGVQKPRCLVLSKMDLADPAATEQWLAFFHTDTTSCIAVNLQERKASQQIVREALSLMKPKWERDRKKGIRPRPARAMVCGVPNVGKSTLINTITGHKIVQAQDRPGVTRSLTWIHADPMLDLLDTPGLTPPKFADEKTGSLLAALGMINDDILQPKSIAMDTIHVLQDLYPGVMEEYFEAGEVNPNGMLKAIAKQRNMMKSGGELDTNQAAISFLQDLRKGRLGRFTLERPDEKDL